MNPKGVDYIGIFTSFYFLILFSLIVLTFYLIISTIVFFKRKTQNDRELLNRLDQLIELQKKQLDNEPNQLK